MKVNKNDKKTLVLLDAHAIIHRAYHALPSFSNSQGEPTGALYGVMIMLLGIIEKLKPDYVVACFDLPQKTFRHEAFDDYKGTRSKTDDALISQLGRARDIFSSLHIPIYDCPGFEADDILGTIAQQTKDQKDLRVIIASGDMDTLQLVEDDRVTVFTLRKGMNDTELYNEEKVFDRFSFSPKYIPDYKGLRGDPSDNIPGVKGIGEKTGMVLISKYHTIENLYENLKTNKEDVKENTKITPRIIDLLLENEDEAIFSKTLATIRRDVPISFVLPNEFSFSVSYPYIKDLCIQLEFKSLLPRLEKLSGITSDSRDYDVSDSEKNEILIGHSLIKAEGGSPSIADVSFWTKTHNGKEMLSLVKERITADGLDFVFNNIEIPLSPIVKEMEDNGICVDVDYLNNLSSEYHQELTSIEKKIFSYTKEVFNINSPKQLGTVLFDELQLGANLKLKKSAGGARSTRESELEKIKNEHEIVPLILSYRELQKLLSTYIDTLPNLVKADGRIHAKFLPLGTTTGRFSSENPNMQNIPIKSESGKRIRNAFVAPKNFVLVSFDYSQIELRVAALMSKDYFMKESFERGEDIHTAVAKKVFSVSEKEVTYDMRRRAKIINFGILYGMGVLALKDALGTSKKEAEEFYDAYFKQFPSIAHYLEGVKAFAKQHGYTKTLFGRRRYFKDLKSPLPYIRAMAERMAINAPIQGTAADIMKLGMIKADADIKKQNLNTDARLILQVHDEIIYEVKKEKLDEIITVVKHALENAIPDDFSTEFAIPLSVSVEVGSSWGEMEEIVIS